MTEFVAGTLSWSGESLFACSLPRTALSHPASERLSGVVVAQTQIPTASDDCITLSTNFVYQEFLLPADYPRGGVIPPLTGLSVFTNIASGRQNAAALDYRIDYYLPGSGWTGLVEGTSVGIHTDSATDSPYDGVWFDIYFEPEDISDLWQYRWRFAVRGRAASNNSINIPVEYDGTYVVINNKQIQVVPNISPVKLIEGERYAFDHDGTPAVLYVEPGSGQVYYSVQQGVDCLWYSSPNPLAVGANLRAFQQDGVTQITDGGASVSLLFRVLAGVADSGRDFLGNNYRNVVTKANASNISTEAIDRFWLSKPNPSRFGVESLYFDVRSGEDAVVVDRIHLDPLTPGVYFNIYYSNDPIPGYDETTWDNLMWERVPAIFVMHRRETHVLPRPITAKYIKLEFSHLQARHYAPGNFQRPTIYKKFPKWVTDYYLAAYATKVDPTRYTKSVVTLRYDALDLAYNYYLDDIRQQPDYPNVVEGMADVAALKRFLSAEPSLADQADAETLGQIKLAFRPFLNSPHSLGRFGDLLFEYGNPSDEQRQNYSTEVIRRARAQTGQVAADDLDQIVVEKQYPVMSFFLTCRHRYKLSSSYFERDQAYFAGVKEVAFTREHYASKFDHPLYIESAGDNVTVERNDFATKNFTWVVYATS